MTFFNQQKRYRDEPIGVQNYWISGLYTSSGILNTSKTQRFRHWIPKFPVSSHSSIAAKLISLYYVKIKIKFH